MTESLRILILDVETTTQKAFESTLGDSVRVTTHKEFDDLMASIGEPDSIPHFVLISCRLPNWTDYSRRCFRERSTIPIAVICDRSLPVVDQARVFASAKDARAGNIIFKPSKPNELSEVIKWALGYKLSPDALHTCKKYLVGESPEIQRVRWQTIAIANQICKKTSRCTLIRGETGTGKEQVARAIEALTGIEMIVVDIKTLPPDTVASELFGSKAGAFTGAVNKIGHFEKANGKILLLDEFGNITKEVQEMLLRVLDEKGEFYRVGCTIARRINCHILFATNQPLEEMVASNQFRDDLCFRIQQGTQLHMPPLRDRVADAPILAAHLIELRQPESRIELGDVAKHMLESHTFPGNVRELISMVNAGFQNPSGTFNLLEMLGGLTKKADNGKANAESIGILLAEQVLDDPLFTVEEKVQRKVDSIYFRHLYDKFQGDFKKIKAHSGGGADKPLTGRPFYERWDNADPPLPPRPERKPGEKE